MTGLLRKTFFAGFIFIFSVGSALADDILMPFVLAGTSSGDVASVSSEVKSKLTAGGFQVVGEYSPYADANIIIVTNDHLKAEAAKRFGHQKRRQHRGRVHQPDLHGRRLPHGQRPA
jgi:hypothetical protein